MKKFLIRFIFTLIFTFIYFVIFIFYFKPIFVANNVIFPYAMHPFDISNLYPDIWSIIKNMSLICCVLSSIIISNSIFSIFSKLFLKNKKSNTNHISKRTNTNELSLFIGENDEKEKIFIPEKGLFQNILITRWYRYWKNQFSFISYYKSIN
ncbi:MAG: hypothetical protein IKF52_00835 [Clostridia bacterium]|nr:hypothetical protein [Clostridia bacterium]